MALTEVLKSALSQAVLISLAMGLGYLSNYKQANEPN